MHTSRASLKPLLDGEDTSLTRLCALFTGADSIRDVIAFPKNKSGRDTRTDTPSAIKVEQLDELGISLRPKS